MIEAKFVVEREDFKLTADFQMPGKGVTALFGQSGSGKTTTINAICGLVKPDHGTIKINDHTLFDSVKSINVPTSKRGLGYVFQEGRLFPHMTVQENLFYGMKSKNISIPSKEDTINILGLRKFLYRKPLSLSGGERQRVAIGRALLCSPKILLMDEPLAALDVARKQELLPYISTLRDILKIPIIYVSHQIDEIMHLADTLILLNNGEIVAQGPVSEVINATKNSSYFGIGVKSSFLTCIINNHETEARITNLGFNGGSISTKFIDKPIGTKIRAKIRAQDIAIALKRPTDISIANIFETRIHSIEINDLNFMDLQLMVKDTIIWSRLTRRSVSNLQLTPGQMVFALIKSTAIEVLS